MSPGGMNNTFGLLSVGHSTRPAQDLLSSSVESLWMYNEHTRALGGKWELGDGEWGCHKLGFGLKPWPPNLPPPSPRLLLSTSMMMVMMMILIIIVVMIIRWNSWEYVLIGRNKRGKRIGQSQNITWIPGFFIFFSPSPHSKWEEAKRLPRSEKTKGMSRQPRLLSSCPKRAGDGRRIHSIGVKWDAPKLVFAFVPLVTSPIRLATITITTIPKQPWTENRSKPTQSANLVLLPMTESACIQPTIHLPIRVHEVLGWYDHAYLCNQVRTNENVGWKTLLLDVLNHVCVIFIELAFFTI